MTEKQLCAFVEKYNDAVELDYQPMSYTDNITTINLLDDLMTTHDVDAPQWIEASAVASDGTRYWARVDRRMYRCIPSMAEIDAHMRAVNLANSRSEAK